MTATSTFLEKWRGVLTREPIALIAIDLGTKVIRVGSRGVIFNGNWYDPVLIGEGSISVSEPILNADVTLATMTFKVADVPLSIDGGTNIGTLLHNYQVIGKPVTLTFWDHSLTDANDAFVRFTGRIQNWSQNIKEISFRCIQDSNWNTDFAPKRVTRKDFPQALEATVGSPLGIAIGRVSGPAMRPPYPDEFGQFYNARESIAGGQTVGPAVVVDAGRADQFSEGKAKIIVATHKCAGFINDPAGDFGVSAFLQAPDGNLHQVIPDANDVFNNDTDGCGFYLRQNAYNIRCPIFPVAVRGSTQLAENAHALLDPRNETTAALLDFNANKRDLVLEFPNIDDSIGSPSHINGRVFVVYRGSANLTGLSVWLYGGAQGNFGTQVGVLGPTNGFTPAIFNFQINSNFTKPDPEWNYSLCTIRFEWQGVPTGKAEVLLAGLSIPYSQKRDVYTSSKYVKRVPVQKSRRHTLSRKWHQYTVWQDREVTDSVTELRSKFFANIKGMLDDASGTFSGIPNALVERFPDVIALILNKLAGVPLANIVTASNSFGSFTDARTLLTDGNRRDLRAALLLNEDIDVASVLGWLCSASASGLVYSESDAKWRLHPWVINPAVSYARKISKADILDPANGVSVSITPTSDVLSSLRIAYGYDAASLGYKHETMVSADGSVGGHANRNLRDGLLKITQGVNDKIDIVGATSGSRTLTINAGDYDHAGLLSALKAAFIPLNASVACGGYIVANVNDKLRYEVLLMINSVVTSVYITATLNPGFYASMDLLAAEAQRALNANSTYGNWTVSYNAAQKVFNFAKTRSSTDELVWGWRQVADPAYCAFGLPMTVYTSTMTSTSTVEMDKFSIALEENWNMLWRNGANGQVGTKTSAWEVLGFDWADDLRGIDSQVSRHVGHSIKNAAEKSMIEANTNFGKKRTLTIEARAINDTQTAHALRTKLVAIQSKPRGIVSFASEILVDIQRGHVFQFDDDMDTLKPYSAFGSGGSWIGRKFRVLDVVQKFGNSWHNEITAVDVTD